MPYVQPALGEGLSRDRTLRLVVFAGAAPLPATIPGAEVAAFLDEFFAITEGAAPSDPEYGAIRSTLIGDVPLVELDRGQ